MPTARHQDLDTDWADLPGNLHRDVRHTVRATRPDAPTCTNARHPEAARRGSLCSDGKPHGVPDATRPATSPSQVCYGPPAARDPPAATRYSRREPSEVR